MNIQTTCAKNRFSTLKFGAGSNSTQTTTTYTCSNCGTKRVFKIQEFSGSLFNTKSCLNTTTIKEIDKIRHLKKEDWEDFIDFKCSGCDLEVRVVYSSNEFRMACHNFLLKDVVELLGRVSS